MDLGEEAKDPQIIFLNKLKNQTSSGGHKLYTAALGN